MLMPQRVADAVSIQHHADGRFSTVVRINDRPVDVEWTAAAARALAARSAPLVVELELLFSCLVRKSVLFHDATPPAGSDVVTVHDTLQLCFRPVTADACSMEKAERLGRQPVSPIDTPAARRLAPRRVWLDHAQGRWQGEFWC
jgi:hypothetical protein